MTTERQDAYMLWLKLPRAAQNRTSLENVMDVLAVLKQPARSPLLPHDQIPDTVDALQREILRVVKMPAAGNRDSAIMLERRHYVQLLRTRLRAINPDAAMYYEWTPPADKPHYRSA